MTRVLVIGGAGTLGAAVVRRLLPDPAYDLRVADARPAPQWLREGCEIDRSALAEPGRARAALDGCSLVIDLADRRAAGPFTRIEADGGVRVAVLRAALDLGVERFVYVSSGAVLERATAFPTTEAHLAGCAPPTAADGFSQLAGEVACRAAHAERGLPFTICRACDAYGTQEPFDAERGLARDLPGLVARALAGEPAPMDDGAEDDDGPGSGALTHVDDVAEGIVAALAAPAALGEDFNLAGPEELTRGELTRLVWELCGDAEHAAAATAPTTPPRAGARRWPSAEKARAVLGWEARTSVRDGIARLAAWQRAHDPVAARR